MNSNHILATLSNYSCTTTCRGCETPVYLLFSQRQSILNRIEYTCVLIIRIDTTIIEKHVRLCTYSNGVFIWKKGRYEGPCLPPPFFVPIKVCIRSNIIYSLYQWFLTCAIRPTERHFCPSERTLIRLMTERRNRLDNRNKGDLRLSLIDIATLAATRQAQGSR